jgi:hypothetical protein
MPAGEVTVTPIRRIRVPVAERLDVSNMARRMDDGSGTPISRNEDGPLKDRASTAGVSARHAR